MDVACLSDDIYSHVLIKARQLFLALRLRIISCEEGARLDIIHNQVFECAIVRVIFYGLLLHVVD